MPVLFRKLLESFPTKSPIATNDIPTQIPLNGSAMYPSRISIVWTSICRQPIVKKMIGKKANSPTIMIIIDFSFFCTETGPHIYVIYICDYYDNPSLF